MNPTVRRAFPYVVGVLALAALAWAVSFGTLPRAEVAFVNGTDIKTIDPAKVTGAPEGRVINMIFEGLYRNHPVGLEIDDDGNIVKWPEPDADGNVPMRPEPAIAEDCEISQDGKTYTFTIRDGALWSDGTKITAHDFAWSWQRMLHPETASRYAYQLYYVVGAKLYNISTVEAGNQVEVELADRVEEFQTYPRGTIRRGTLRQIAKPPEPDTTGYDDEEKEDAEVAWRKSWTYLVEEPMGVLRAYSKDPEISLPDPFPGKKFDGGVRKCMFVLPDFESTVGIKATDERTLVINLKNRTPFFLDLVAFYPLYPVNRRCVEKYGSPLWTKTENAVTNGPFLLHFRRIRDRVRVVKNPKYWNAKVVKLATVDALSVESQTTMLNMFLNDQCDWITDVPNKLIPDLREQLPNEFIVSPQLASYFYRINVTKPPLDDVHVRRALNMAINKQEICEHVSKAGELPARSFVPPGLAGYQSQLGGEFDPERAKQELQKSKYMREGRKFPKIEIVYNTNENHKAIAEVIQQQWKVNLGIDVGLSNSEWQSFLDTVHQMEYSVARAGWIGDYPDPNTFLDMWVGGGENNETGWSNEEYDRLIADAKAEPDSEERMRLFERAEAILMDEQPIIPIYFYVSKNMAKPRLKGFFGNIQDLHPVHLMRVED